MIRNDAPQNSSQYAMLLAIFWQHGRGKEPKDLGVPLLHSRPGSNRE